MSLPGGVESALARYRADLRDRFQDRIRRVVVFGSVARGEATEDSDVDVLVLLDTVSPAERNAALDLAGLIAMDTGIALSPVVLAAQEWHELQARERGLTKEIARDGVDV